MQCYFSRIALVVLLCWGVLGCAPSPQNQKFYIAELPSSTKPATSMQTEVALPPVARVRPREFPSRLWLDRLFRSRELHSLKSLDNLDTILAPENPFLTRGLRMRHKTGELDTALVPKNYNVTMVTHCDTEILKAFVATGWWPFVLLRHGNQIERWLVVGYDDSGNISLRDPRGPRVKRSVTEFQREWKHPSPSQCVLITLEKLNKYDVRRRLQKYLPLAKVSQIHVRPVRRPNRRTAEKC
jgi:hypothetical protein